jgi:DNA helicase-2/ATP-dependent DNA helicase PcrA
LNDEQRQVVVHDAGPLLVLAGPGSGKTRVITRHIAYRVAERHDAPSSILAITFTNRAAAEMRSRVHALLGGDGAVPIGTFHWMASAFLRRHGHRLGFARDFRLLSPSEARSVLAGVIPPAWKPYAVAEAVSSIKNGGSSHSAARAAGIPENDLLAVVRTYDSRLRAMVALDLDDLLACSVRLLTEDESLRLSVRSRLTALLVDEFQDTNLIQARLLDLLAPVNRTVIAVGDDDQAIYSWRGAGSGAALFNTSFPDTQVVVLGQSYRHAKHVLRAAASLIEHGTGRELKTLRTQRHAGAVPVEFVAGDEVEEADWIAAQVRRLCADGVPYSEMAILYRINAQSRSIEDALVRASIPYHILAGNRFYDRPEIRHALAYLRLALDPADAGAARALFSSVHGVGDVRLTELVSAAARAESTLPALLLTDHRPPGIPPAVWIRAQATARRVVDVTGVRAARLPLVVSAAVEATLTDLGGRERASDDVVETLEELRSVADELHGVRGTLRSLVDRTAMSHDGAPEREGVNLLSLHAAKGLEFDGVFVVGLEEGLLPHRRSLDSDAAVEEERRLLFVGMTRAREYLFLTHARMRLLGGHALVGGASRFLREIGAANVKTELSPRSAQRPRLATVHVGERVRHQRWGLGTVVSIEGRGRDTLTTILFDSIGRQRLQLVHAPLERVDRETDLPHDG